MKICLVRPDSIIVACPPPLGLGYLAGYLGKKRKDEVEIIDGRRLRINAAEMVSRLKISKPGLVGITALSFEAKEAHELAAAIKKEMPGVLIVLGGPYATSVGEAVLEDGSFDYAVAGEGEETFIELLNALESSQPLERIPGLMLRVDNQPRLVGVRPPKQEIDELEISWPLLDPEKYFGSRIRNSENTLKHSSRLLPVFTSRGCPYNCYFCHNLFGKKFRARSADHVLAEIDFLVREYGVEELEIVDDSFNLDARRGKEILKKIAGRGYKLWLSFPNGIRADLMDEEFLDLMKAAGTYRVDYAIESANPERQIEMKKRLDLGRVKWTIEQTYKRGIMAAGYFILGFPHETEAEMKTTIDFALDSKLQIASFFHLNPFPGTALVESDEQLRALSRRISLADYSTLTMNLSAVSDQQLKNFRKSAYRRFYFSPFRIWSNLLLAPKNFRTVRSVFDVVMLSTKDSVNY